MRDEGFCVIRTPLLPASVFTEWAALGEDRAERRDDVLADGLREICDRPVVQEALRFASSSLFERLSRHRERPRWTRSELDADRLTVPLVRYLSRMTTRCTPFGLFAGYSAVPIDDAGAGLVLDDTLDRRRAFASPTLMYDAFDALPALDRADPSIAYELNPTAFQAHDGTRFFEWNRRRGAYDYASIDDDLVRLLVERRSPVTVELVDRLLNLDLGRRGSPEQAVVELVRSGVLIDPDLPALSRSDPPSLGAFSTRCTPDQAARYARIDELFRDLNDAPLGAVGLLDALDEARTIEDHALGGIRAVQVLLQRAMPAGRLSRTAVDEVVDAADTLRRITPPRETDDIVAFRERFEGRYGEREVPLLLVLDPDLGLGFDVVRPETRDLPPAHELALAERLDASASSMLELDDELVEELANGDALALPSSFAAQVHLTSTEAFVMAGVAGPPGTKTIGRFCIGDPGLTDRVRRALNDEPIGPDAVYAEIVHVPTPRHTAGLVMRPPLRTLDIPVLGRSELPVAQQIPAADLLVSLHGSHIMLRSKRLDRWVIPRLSAAHNRHISPVPLYRFLCALQEQQAASSARWSWGRLGFRSHLPRVARGNAVFAPETGGWQGAMSTCSPDVHRRSQR